MRRTHARSVRLVGVALLVAVGGGALAAYAEEQRGDTGGPSPGAAVRARLVAEAWDGSRAAEVWRAGYHPSGETVQLPEDALRGTDKEAYAARDFELRGELPDLAREEGTVRWKGGGSLTLPLTDAREAFADLDRSDGRAPLTVTGVRLGEMTLATDRGPATVPAWLFTLDGYGTPLKQAAVSPSEPPRSPIGPARDTLGDELGPLPGPGRVAVDGRTVTVVAWHGGCDDGPAVHALETAGSVVLSASVAGAGDGPCTAELLAAEVTVRLDRPLGDRVLLDAFTGRPVAFGERRG
ncbi:hypothetical protein [Streptomyces sp. MN13]